MVRRIIPTRLLSSSSVTSGNSTKVNSSHQSKKSISNGAHKTIVMRSRNGDGLSTPGGLNNALTLKVVVLKARDLAAKDRGGTSDPYLVLTLGDSRAVTHAVPKTLNPEWNAIEELPVSSVSSLVLDVIAWDKDRFGKDYLGEFDLALEEIFANGRTEQEAKWYPLRSKRPGKKTSLVSGEVLLQFTLFEDGNPDASPEQVYETFQSLISTIPDASRHGTPGTQTPSMGAQLTPRAAPGSYFGEAGSPEDFDDEFDVDSETPEDTEDGNKDAVEKRRRRLRIKGLKRKNRQNPYAFTNGSSDVVGLIFLEISKITDLPPERNLTRTSFDMDPFVVASLGKKTYRTRRVRHNLNPVYNEKMMFQVLGHEQQYSFAFTVIDHDKYSGNDFIASCNLPLSDLIEKAPEADTKTGLYDIPEPAEYSPQAQRFRLKRLGLSRTSSSQSVSKIMRPQLSKAVSNAGAAQPSPDSTKPSSLAPSSIPSDTVPSAAADPSDSSLTVEEQDDPDFHEYQIPMKLKNLDKWETKHNPTMFVRAKYMPYSALRQQFWRAMLKQYDTDESGRISRVELTTMLDTLGSTLSENTIDGFFQRFPHHEVDSDWELTMDEAVICLEDQLAAKSKPLTIGEKMHNLKAGMKHLLSDGDPAAELHAPDASTPKISGDSQVPTIAVPEHATPGEEGALMKDDLTEDHEEHVVEIRECPICHQPRLNKRNDTDIITHIATCASSDWRQVNTVLMGGFVTASQAQRKWYSKVITKISYGGYKLGANSANILVQDRTTGQISEEKMSVYVRLGIRLLYKGLKSRDMENKRIRKLLKNLSVKQGRKFDDPASKDEIEKFIDFHGLDMSEVLLPLEEFKNFNEFFYRALKPDARPCSAPERPDIIVSPADCRSVVFNEITQATKIWVKGREFNLKRLMGDAYPEDAARFEGGALGVFRLAPQDYHRFHIPVDGVMGEPKLIEGEYYTVNPMAIRSALDVYGENIRVLVPIDSEKHGRVMVVCVGAMMVGSTVITRNAGDHVKRAEELGYFKFGGSTLLVLFEPGKMKWDDDMVDNSNGALETLIRVGMSVGHSPSAAPHGPDMLKKVEDTTDADRRAARRRIQGSISMASPDGSDEDPPPRKLTTRPTMNTFAASAM